MTRESPDAAEELVARGAVQRRAIVSVIIVIISVEPLVHVLSRPVIAAGWFQVAAVVPFVALVLWQLNAADLDPQRTPWAALLVIVALAISLVVLGGKDGNWVPALAIAAAVCGRSGRTPWPAIAGSAACAIAGLVVATVYHYTWGTTFSVAVVALLAGFLAYSAARRADAIRMLRRTRAELARAAAAEERLRIARDLHDLLGHSLSLITLKAELAGRLVPADPARAAREIAELEGVARQSLSDVREAVAGFRQPDLAGELVAARQLLDAAGIASHITALDTDGLAQPVDAALAWAVREGTTNVVRHSRATHVAIRVTRDDAAVIAEISDNGPAAVDEGGAAGEVSPVPTTGPAGRAITRRVRPAFTGSGLAGLAERIRSLGGELAAGAIEPQGFLLRIVLPLSPQA